MQIEDTDRKFYSIPEFAKLMRYHPGSIRRLIRNGTIFAFKIGDGNKSRYRISETEIERIQIKGFANIVKDSDADGLG